MMLNWMCHIFMSQAVRTSAISLRVPASPTSDAGDSFMFKSRAARSLCCADLVALIEASVAVGPFMSLPWEGLMLSESGS